MIDKLHYEYLLRKLIGFKHYFFNLSSIVSITEIGHHNLLLQDLE